MEVEREVEGETSAVKDWTDRPKQEGEIGKWLAN